MSADGRGLSHGLARWRAPRAVRDPGKIVADQAAEVALGGAAWPISRCCGSGLPWQAGGVGPGGVPLLVAALAGDLTRALKAIRAARAAARERA